MNVCSSRDRCICKGTVPSEIGWTYDASARCEAQVKKRANAVCCRKPVMSTGTPTQIRLSHGLLLMLLVLRLRFFCCAVLIVLSTPSCTHREAEGRGLDLRIQQAVDGVYTIRVTQLDHNAHDEEEHQHQPDHTRNCVV